MEGHVTNLLVRGESVLNQMAMGVEGSDLAARTLSRELRTASREIPGAGVFLRPMAARLKAARKPRVQSRALGWVMLGGGGIAVGHRPRLRAIPDFPHLGVTHIVTLLSAREGAASIEAAARKARIGWIWVPLESAAPPEVGRVPGFRRLYDRLGAILADGGRVFIHCTAGIHRTGMITHGLMRSMGVPGNEARSLLRSLRPETAEGVGEDRLAWGDQFG